jgi:2-polyprenyl-3-methyl-5-hydroxy-6-metoxy-1,4-benzoquinol methylase
MPPAMQPRDTVDDAVSFHDRTAREFDDLYTRDERFRSRYRVWNGLLARYSRPGFRVLDVGCGSGTLSAFAAPMNGSVLGFDGSVAMVELAQAKCREAGLANTAFRVGRVEELPGLAGEPVDLLLCSSVLEYLAALDTALDALVAATRRGGVLLLSMPNGSSLYRKLEPLTFRLTGRPVIFPYVRSVLTPAGLARRLAARDCALEETAFYGAVPGWSAVCRALGRPAWSETLFVAAFRRH